MKLELHHLAPYLPYGLKIYQISRGTFTTSDDVTDVIELTTTNLNAILLHKQYRVISKKPILRPLSDLTKEIEHNGERFVPIDKLNELYGDYHLYLEDNGELFIKDLCELNMFHRSNLYEFLQPLLKWHFDIFSLIPNNLAIDINTI